MRRTRINPGDTVPLAFNNNEWEFLQNEVLFISEELEKKLRLAVTEGDRFIVRLDLDDADELAGAVAAEANHCPNKKKQKQWDQIFDKVQALLETYTDEDEPPPPNEDNLDSLLPPELAEQIRSTIQNNKFSSLDELNAAISTIMMDYNRRPQSGLGGLSPEQIHHLIDLDWENPSSALRLHTELPNEELLAAPIVRDARTFLAGIMEEGGSIQATNTGNLNRQFIQKMVKRFCPPPEFISWTIEHKTALNEDNVFHIHLVRILLKIAGLIRKQKTLFKITQKGEKYVQEKHAAELYALLFKTHFRKLNLAYLDGTPENQPLQDTIAYSFYAIKKHLRDWKKPEDIAEQITLPIVQEYLYEYKDLGTQVKTRILEPLTRFGLLQTRPLPQEEKKISIQHEYRKTPLYDQLLQFKQ